jgi:hypothetical protein
LADRDVAGVSAEFGNPLDSFAAPDRRQRRHCPYSPVRVITSDGLIGAATTSTSACPALSRGVSNSAG